MHPNPTPTSDDAPAPAAPSGPRGRVAAKTVKVLLSIGMGAAILYGLQRGGLPVVPSSEALSAVRWWAFPVYLASVLVSSYYRGGRWRFLLRPLTPVSRATALHAVLVGSAAVLLLPLRLGEMVRPYLVADGKRVGMIPALSTVVAERIIDGLILSIILGLALVFVPARDPLPTSVVGIPVGVAAVRGYAWSFLVIFAVAFLAIIVFHFAHPFGIRLTHLVFGKIWPRMGTLVATTIERFAGGLGFFRRADVAWGFTLETGLYWFSGVLGMWALGCGAGITHADGSAMTFGEASAAMGMLGIASSLPGPPGVLGLFQAGVYAALTMYFPDDIVVGAGSAYVFLLYATHVGFTLIAAAICLALRPAELKETVQAVKQA